MGWILQWSGEGFWGSYKQQYYDTEVSFEKFNEVNAELLYENLEYSKKTSSMFIDIAEDFGIELEAMIAQSYIEKGKFEGRTKLELADSLSNYMGDSVSDIMEWNMYEVLFDSAVIELQEMGVNYGRDYVLRLILTEARKNSKTIIVESDDDYDVDEFQEAFFELNLDRIIINPEINLLFHEITSPYDIIVLEKSKTGCMYIWEGYYK